MSEHTVTKGVSPDLKAVLTFILACVEQEEANCREEAENARQVMALADVDQFTRDHFSAKLPGLEAEHAEAQAVLAVVQRLPFEIEKLQFELETACHLGATLRIERDEAHAKVAELEGELERVRALIRRTPEVAFANQPEDKWICLRCGIEGDLGVVNSLKGWGISNRYRGPVCPECWGKP